MSAEKHRYTISVVFAGKAALPWHYHVSRVYEIRPGRETVRAVESGKTEWKWEALLRAHLAAWTAARDLRREAKPYKREVTR